MVAPGFTTQNKFQFYNLLLGWWRARDLKRTRYIALDCGAERQGDDTIEACTA